MSIDRLVLKALATGLLITISTALQAQAEAPVGRWASPGVHPGSREAIDRKAD
jgi:hypothetical protein